MSVMDLSALMYDQDKFSFSTQTKPDLLEMGALITWILWLRRKSFFNFKPDSNESLYKNVSIYFDAVMSTLNVI